MRCSILASFRRSRDSSSALDTSFYHPGCSRPSRLTTRPSASKFDELFREPPPEIKNFAEGSTKQGRQHSRQRGRCGRHRGTRGGDAGRRTAEDRLQPGAGKIPSRLTAEEGSGPAAAGPPRRRSWRQACLVETQGAGSEGAYPPVVLSRCACIARRSDCRSRFLRKRPSCSRSKNRSGCSCAWPIPSFARSSPCASST